MTKREATHLFLFLTVALNLVPAARASSTCTSVLTADELRELSTNLSNSYRAPMISA